MGRAPIIPPTTDNRPQSPRPAEPLTRHNTPMAGSRRIWVLPKLTMPSRPPAGTACPSSRTNNAQSNACPSISKSCQSISKSSRQPQRNPYVCAGTCGDRLARSLRALVNLSVLPAWLILKLVANCGYPAIGSYVYVGRIDGVMSGSDRVVHAEDLGSFDVVAPRAAGVWTLDPRPRIERAS